MAGRVRSLADAVGEFTAELRANRQALPKMDVKRLDGRAREAADRLRASIDAFTKELATTNHHLNDLAHRPIVGFLGGGAEEQLQRLVGNVDALRQEVGRWRDLVPK
jgi:primosomal protein N''